MRITRVTVCCRSLIELEDDEAPPLKSFHDDQRCANRKYKENRSASFATKTQSQVVGRFDFRQAKRNSERVREADGGIKPGASAANPGENEAKELLSPRSGRRPVGQMYRRIRSRLPTWCHAESWQEPSSASR